MWTCERVYPWYIPMNHKSLWFIQFFRGEIAMFSMVNPEVRPGGKGKDSKDPNTVRKPLLAAEFEKRWKKNMGIGLGDMGENMGEITWDHEITREYVSILNSYDLFWDILGLEWRHGRFDECPVDEFHGVYTNRRWFMVLYGNPYESYGVCRFVQK